MNKEDIYNELTEIAKHLYDEIIKYNIIQCIVSEEYAVLLGKNAPSEVRCHIKIDTGMGRIGLKHETPSECCEQILRIMNIENKTNNT